MRSTETCWARGRQLARSTRSVTLNPLLLFITLQFILERRLILVLAAFNDCSWHLVRAEHLHSKYPYRMD